MSEICVGSPDLKFDGLVGLAARASRILVPEGPRGRIRESRRTIDQALSEGRTVYGVNTGFGKLSGVSIPEDQLAVLQKNLLLSHATGVGELLSEDICRLAFGLRIHNLALGFSGVRLELIERMEGMFNASMSPVMPSQGSVGASGDLAPLAHMALPLIGRGEVYHDGEVITGQAALDRLGWAPLDLAAKEGLALINGTQVMTAIGLIALARAIDLSKAADIACAMTVEALRGSDQPFAEAVHAVRPHEGQRLTAANLRTLLESSEILLSHQECEKVQDAYSIRCAPQVHGAVKGALHHVMTVLVNEGNSVTDNPIVFSNGDVISAGNFHGQPVSQALDFLSIGISTLANISERRTENLVNPDISGLPPVLAATPGIESGFMIPQVVAASLASENKTLAHPASVDTIPTSANREDHVSMGVTAARHAMQIVVNTTNVIAIECLCGAQGLDCGESLRPGKGVAQAYEVIRERVASLDSDRYLAPDVKAIGDLLASGDLVRRVEEAVGELHS